MASKGEAECEPRTEVKFDYHRDGGWKTLQVGETKVDFEKGVVTHPDGDTDKLTESLKKHPPHKYCRSFHLEVRDQNLHVRLDEDEAIHTVESDDVWDATGFHFKVMYLTATVAGCDIKLTASTSIYGFSSFWPVKKKLDEIQDGTAGDFDSDTDSLHDIREALDAIGESIKTTSSLTYDVSAIDATTANADTKIIGIDNATYPIFEVSEIYIDISDWNGKYGAGKILTVEMQIDVQGTGAPKSLKKKTYTQGTDTEEVLVIDDIKAGEDVDIYVYCDDETGGDFTIYYTYVLTEVVSA